MNIQKPEIAIFIMLLVGITFSPVYSQTPQDETALTSPALKEISPQQKPILPSWNISASPPTGLVITGMPKAIASRTELGMPSP